MKSLIMGILLILSTSLAYATGENAAYDPVQYARICQLYGTGYIYIPETEQCLNVSSGIIKEEIGPGTITSDSILLQRIRSLESQLQAMQAQLGVYPAE